MQGIMVMVTRFDMRHQPIIRTACSYRLKASPWKWRKGWRAAPDWFAQNWKTPLSKEEAGC